MRSVRVRVYVGHTNFEELVEKDVNSLCQELFSFEDGAVWKARIKSLTFDIDLFFCKSLTCSLNVLAVRCL